MVTSLKIHTFYCSGVDNVEGVEGGEDDGEYGLTLSTPSHVHRVVTSAKKSGGRPKSFVWQYYNQVSDANNKSKRCKVIFSSHLCQHMPCQSHPNNNILCQRSVI